MEKETQHHGVQITLELSYTMNIFELMLGLPRTAELLTQYTP